MDVSTATRVVVTTTNKYFHLCELMKEKREPHPIQAGALCDQCDRVANRSTAVTGGFCHSDSLLMQGVC
jgi:hypothetical protein